MQTLDNSGIQEQVLTLPAVEESTKDRIAKRRDKHIYLVSDDEALCDDLRLRMEANGYRASFYTQIEQFKQAVIDNVPAAIVCALAFENDGTAGASTILNLQRQLKDELGVVFIAADGGMEARLAAVRANGKFFIETPVNFTRLIEAVDELAIGASASPHRVLIVDDDEELSSYYQAILESEGISARVENNPINIISVINAFKPELMILDVYVPNCSGIELAAVIRQETKWNDIPIIFISADKGIIRELSQSGVGGDEYLSKPVAPNYLLSILRPKLARARVLQEARRRLEMTLLELSGRTHALDRHSILALTDESGALVYFNQVFKELFSSSYQDLLGRDLLELFNRDNQQAWVRKNRARIFSMAVWHGELAVFDETHRVHKWLKSTIVPFINEVHQVYQYALVATDISELKQAQTILSSTMKELTQRNKDLDLALIETNKAYQVRSKFIGNVSHELRTPLNGILGMSDLLAKSDLNKEQQDFVANIQDSANKLLGLVNDVLEVTKSDADVLQEHVNVERFDVFQLIDEVLSKRAERCSQARDVLLYDNIAKDVPRYVMGVHDKIRKVLEYLVDNALYLTPHGVVRVGVSVYSEDDNKYLLDFSIEDNGQGMLLDEIGLDMRDDSASPSSSNFIKRAEGLNLAQCKKYVTQLGGHLLVQSALGEGSRFSFCLPLGKIKPEHDHNLSPTPQGTYLLLSDDSYIGVRVRDWLRALVGDVVVDTVMLEDYHKRNPQLCFPYDACICLCQKGDNDAMTMLKDAVVDIQARMSQPILILGAQSAHVEGEEAEVVHAAYPITRYKFTEFLVKMIKRELSSSVV